VSAAIDSDWRLCALPDILTEMLQRLASCLALLAIAGCSNDAYHTSGPGGSLDGTVPPYNAPFTPMDAIYRPQLPAYVNSFGTIIRMTDYAWACETAVIGRTVAGGHFIEINLPGVPVVQGAPEDIPLGTYRIPYGPPNDRTRIARVGYRAYDAACAPEGLAPTDRYYAFDAWQGTVTVEAFQPGTLRGSFDVYFSGDLRLAGHFVAQRCDSLGWDENNTPGALCLPPIECTPVPTDGGNVAVLNCH
jgi:hypothetical protein